MLPLLLACADPAHTRPWGADPADTAADGAPDSGRDSAADSARDSARDSAADSGGDSADTGPPPPCATTVTYGAAWIHDTSTHPARFDVADGLVTWDGVCTDDAWGNSYAVLSNGWVPYFAGSSACVMALDASAGCTEAPASCRSLVHYGPNWIPAADHPAYEDLVAGRLFVGGECTWSGSDAHQLLSNGWEPWFDGACALSFRHEQCGGLYENPVVAQDCPDPGVVEVPGGYLMTCTGGASDGGVYPLRRSTDLVHWEEVGSIFPRGSAPSWASGDWWAPEVHPLGEGWIAVFTARAAADGQLSVGAAFADDPFGPWTDLGGPLLHDASMGLIDATVVADEAGAPWIAWKEDGNAVGRHTPIHAAPLAADGRSLAGSAVTLITNDRAWEGAVVEGPWLYRHEGTWYLFYSGNGYASAAYALGVARAPDLSGPWEKAAAPILTSGGDWEGPGHGSVLPGPGGDLYLVYHAWVRGQVGGGPGRLVLVDQVQWADGWPLLRGAPSSGSLPLP